MMITFIMHHSLSVPHIGLHTDLWKYKRFGHIHDWKKKNVMNGLVLVSDKIHMHNYFSVLTKINEDAHNSSLDDIGKDLAAKHRPTLRPKTVSL